MVKLTDLKAGVARVVIAPELGGGIAHLEVGDRPVLRPWDGDASNPFTLASNILAPFSNRISQGGFDWAGESHAVEANLTGEAFPIHGDGFQKAWSISQSGSQAQLMLLNGDIGPWRYRAVQDIELSETALEIMLTLTNTGPDSLPFGCGFHPWFPRNAGTRVSFDAKAVWLENEQFLPTQKLYLRDAAEWCFGTKRPLPAGWINNTFSNWEGTARIYQNQDAYPCLIQASENLSTAIVYSPGENTDFFCFEPVSHPVDAFHLSGSPGLKELAPHQSLKASMKISWNLE